VPVAFAIVRHPLELAIACVANKQRDDLRKQQRDV
jgi:hypothetical protein